MKSPWPHCGTGGSGSGGVPRSNLLHSELVSRLSSAAESSSKKSASGIDMSSRHGGI